jgi:hypothetical protein
MEDFYQKIVFTHLIYRGKRGDSELSNLVIKNR